MGRLVQARTRPEPENINPNPARKPKTNLKPKSCPRKPKAKLGLKDLAALLSYFDYIFVHVRQKARLRPESSPKFLSPLGPNSTRKARPDLQLWFCLIPKLQQMLQFLILSAQLRTVAELQKRILRFRDFVMSSSRGFF